MLESLAGGVCSSGAGSGWLVEKCVDIAGGLRSVCSVRQVNSLALVCLLVVLQSTS